MPRFRIDGFGKQTNRPRSKVYRADNEYWARVKAEGEGTDIISVKELDPDPATERQIDYAASMGVEIPQGANISEASDLISFALADDVPAKPETVQVADQFGVERTDYAGEKRLYERIFSELSTPGMEEALIRWFAFNAYKDRTRARKGGALSGFNDTKLDAIVNQMALNSKVVLSIKRYNPLGLMFFGERTRKDGFVEPGGSIRSEAYKEASKVIDEVCPVHKSSGRSTTSARRSSPRVARKRSSGRSSKTDVTAALAGFFFVIIAIYVFVF